MRRFFLNLLALIPVSAWAGEVILPSPALERDGPVTVIYRTQPQATGKGQLTIRWTDVYNRVVEDQTIPVELVDETDIQFHLDLRRAGGMRNTLEVRLSLKGVDQAGKPDERNESAQVSFIAKPPDRRWWDYNIIMWQQHPLQVFRELKASYGVSAGQYSGRAKTPPDFLLSNDLRWYAENIATDFYAEYHRFRRDRKPQWSFLQAKELYKKDPTSKEAFNRHPSLSDPVWLQKIHDRLVESARYHSQYRPLFYSLADESGIADLAAFWDFDFSDHSLAAMRTWLKERYTTLAALNAQWGTNFTSWDLVVPETTNEAMKRKDDNFSSWSDHKEWMDIAFARALKMGADAINSVDPEAYVSIGGAQMPGWGGYDYARITSALSAIEPYDIGNNVEIIRSLKPDMVAMTTAFAKGPWEKHRVWYELLHGHRGIIIWDDKADIVSRKDLSVGERGREVKSYYNELRSGIGALLINSTREADPIAIHYSQASMRMEWMLAQRPKGEAWVERTSALERQDSEFLRIRESWCRLIEDLGLQYNFVSYNQLEEGELMKRGYKILVLPRSSALSAAEVQAIRTFVAQGGVVLADGEPGVFDEHCRRLPQPSLRDLFEGSGSGKGKAIRVSFDALNYHQQRLVGREGETHKAMQAIVAEAGVQPAFRLTDASGRPPVGIELHRFRNGGVTILGLHTNPQMRVNELGPPEFKSNERFEKPKEVTLTLPTEMFAVDVRAGKLLGRQSRITVRVDPFEPTLIAVSPMPIPELEITTPASSARGENIFVGMRLASESLADRHVLRFECFGPDGQKMSHYSGNVLAAKGVAARLIPLAKNDPAGRWTVRVTDVLSGKAKEATIDVR